MSTSVFMLLFLAGVALYFMTPEERVRLATSAIAHLRAALRAVVRPAAPADPVNEFLRARTTWPLATPLLIVVNLAVFVGMALAPGALADKSTLIAWGANYAPQTTNGEWWRWLSSIFVHGGVLHLTATLAALATIGIVLERAIGRIAFAAVFFASGVVASIVSLWTSSTTAVAFGASGALFGIYGLLVATLVCGYLRAPRMPISLAALKRILGGGAFCVAYTLMTDHLGLAAELSGMATGLTAGLVLARGVAREKPALPRAAIVVVATLIVAVASFAALEGVIDARPELVRIAVIEDRIAVDYANAVRDFTLGRMPAKKLALFIDRTILPPLRAERARIEALHGIPREQAPMLAAARQYFTLREESWRRRAEGLRTANMKLLREAETSERAALDALQRTRGSTATATP